jgi:DNA-binding transcriptional regulator LsrR (DeoR family)
LNTTVANDMTHFYDLFQSVQWWKYEPKTDTSLVSSSLSSGASRIIAARASDGNSAMVYTPSGSTVTVVMSAMTPSSVRARLFNPTDGSFSTVSGSPFANTGTQNIATGGERVLVLDAA